MEQTASGGAGFAKVIREMRILLKLAVKFAVFVAMVVLMGSGLRKGQGLFTQKSGLPPGMPAAAGQFASEEADLMSTVFQSAIRLFTGQASRTELAGELSDKLYAGRAEAGSMAELGIELVKPGSGSADPQGGIGKANAPGGVSAKGTSPAAAPGGNSIATSSITKPGVGAPSGKPGSAPSGKLGQPATGAPADLLAKNVNTNALERLWLRAKPFSIELGMIPVVFLGMVLVHRRRRRSLDDDFMLPDLKIDTGSDTEPYDMKHAVHSLNSEDFEMLVAMIYQRQGYRITLPAGLGGGRGGDFTMTRKSERILVQCKKLSQDHKVPVERVRELQEGVTAAGVTRGMYVASCGFSWDAHHFAKTKKMTLITARTLDELLKAVKEKPDEDLLAVSQWVPKLMAKVQLTPPVCPACEAAMEEVKASTGTVWVCSQRPECRGRRSARKYQKPVLNAQRNMDAPADEVSA